MNVLDSVWLEQSKKDKIIKEIILTADFETAYYTVCKYITCRSLQPLHASIIHNVSDNQRKTIEFVDVTVKSEPHENKAEELVLFLERYYQSGLSEQEIRKAVNLTAMLVKEKAEKLGARLVLSSSYKNVLENKNYVLTNFYMYISASKNGSQYLDSLGGVAGVSASGSYTCNTFLLEAEERREESL